jgi:5-methyltetrahydropteroyltriglutamate--homocysteine methyltransferase
VALRVASYQHGTYPRSENVVAATRGLERGRTDTREVADAFHEDLVDFVAVQRNAGLDYYSDGLLRWQDLFRPLVESTDGLEARTLVRWFDNNSFFRAPEVIGELELTRPVPEVYLDDDAVPEPRVATLPSPYLFSRAAQHGVDPNALMIDVAREVLGPVVGALGSRGYEIAHLQEPWLGYFGIDRDDWDDFEKALTEIRESAGDGLTLLLHVYFGDAGPHVERLRRLPVDAVGIDLIETDPDSLGSGWEIGLLAGAIDGRSSLIEQAAPAADFVRRVAERVEPAFLFVSSNSDLELLPRDIAREKVLRLGEVTASLKSELS